MSKATIKGNSTSVCQIIKEAQHQRIKSANLSKTCLGKKDFMLNGIHERGLNKDEHIKVKLWRYPGASSIDISDHKKPSLRKEPEKL